jgi:hypothetical protein
MKIPRILISIIAVVLFTFAIKAEDSPKRYANSGDFEISGGLSGAASRNSTGLQRYDLSLLPFANHFLFNRVFLRYDLGLSFAYTRADYLIGGNMFSWSVSPGLAAGYSFELSPVWYLNMSMGYGLVLFQSSYGDGTSSQALTQHSIRAYPELKYVINEKWSISALLQFAGNFVSPLNKVSNSFEVTTRMYIAAAYKL